MLEMASDGAFPGAARATTQKYCHLAENWDFSARMGSKIFSDGRDRKLSVQGPLPCPSDADAASYIRIA